MERYHTRGAEIVRNDSKSVRARKLCGLDYSNDGRRFDLDNQAAFTSFNRPFFVT